MLVGCDQFLFELDWLIGLQDFVIEFDLVVGFVWDYFVYFLVYYVWDVGMLGIGGVGFYVDVVVQWFVGVVEEFDDVEVFVD